jgi:hypothetical protein
LLGEAIVKLSYLPKSIRKVAYIFTEIRHISQQLTFMDLLHTVRCSPTCMYVCTTRGSATRSHNPVITSIIENVPNTEFKMPLVVAQEESGRFSPATVPVRYQIRSCGICAERSGNGARFIRAVRFPLPILIPQTSQHSLVIRHSIVSILTKTKLRGFGPRANYGDRATVACWRSSANCCG